MTNTISHLMRTVCLPHFPAAPPAGFIIDFNSFEAKASSVVRRLLNRSLKPRRSLMFADDGVNHTKLMKTSREDESESHPFKFFLV